MPTRQRSSMYPTPPRTVVSARSGPTTERRPHRLSLVHSVYQPPARLSIRKNSRGASTSCQGRGVAHASGPIAGQRGTKRGPWGGTRQGAARPVQRGPPPLTTRARTRRGWLDRPDQTLYHRFVIRHHLPLMLSRASLRFSNYRIPLSWLGDEAGQKTGNPPGTEPERCREIPTVTLQLDRHHSGALVYPDTIPSLR